MMRNNKKTPEPVAPTVQTSRRVAPPLLGVRLPPFSGDRTSCIKCGHRGAKTIYAAVGAICNHPGKAPSNVWGTERLHRICESCGFSWDEACVPAIPQIVQETLVMPAVRDA